MAPVNDMEIFIAADNDTYKGLVIELYFRGKFISVSGKNVNTTDHTDVTNNFLRSLFSQCDVTINGITSTQASEQYNYRSDLQTLLT